MNRRPTCSPRHRRWCSHDHAQLVSEYRDARDARDALRESTDDAGGTVAGTAGSTAGYAQLSDDEFAELVPPILFRDWLVHHAGRNRQPLEVAS